MEGAQGGRGATAAGRLGSGGFKVECWVRSLFLNKNCSKVLHDAYNNTFVEEFHRLCVRSR